MATHSNTTTNNNPGLNDKPTKKVSRSGMGQGVAAVCCVEPQDFCPKPETLTLHPRAPGLRFATESGTMGLCCFGLGLLFSQSSMSFEFCVSPR